MLEGVEEEEVLSANSNAQAFFIQFSFSVFQWRTSSSSKSSSSSGVGLSKGLLAACAGFESSFTGSYNTKVHRGMD